MVPAVRAQEGALRASEQTVRCHALHGMRRRLSIGAGRRGGRMAMRRHRYAALGVTVLVATLVSFNPAWTQDEGPAPVGAPPTIAPEGAPETAPPVPAASPTAARKPRRAAHHAATAGHFDIEEANARIPLSHDTPIYASPSTGAHQLEQGIAGKYIQVTGVTRHWLRVQLKNGATGYVQQKDAHMVKPTDKIFMLTKNAAVRADANKWSKKLSEVHRGHNVHVIGIALNYVKIRMKSGLEGYIPLTALE